MQFAEAAAESVRARLILLGKVVGIKFSLRRLAAVIAFRPASVPVADLSLVRSPLRLLDLLHSLPLVTDERRARCSRRF